MSDQGVQGILSIHTDEVLANVCKDIIRDQWGIEVGIDEPFRDRGFDSLDVVELCIEVEDTFNVTIVGDQEKMMTSVRGMMDVLREMGI